MNRILKGIAQFHRFPEILRCRSLTPDWLALTLTYLGIRRKLPFHIQLATGPFEFIEFSDVPTFWQIFLANLYPVRPTDRVILDIGANIGAFTLYALVQAPEAHVVAVEPAADTHERMRRMIEAHGFSRRCTLLHAALADEIGTTTIETHAFSQCRVTGQGGDPVSTITLDSLVQGVESVDLLKLDAEGAEYQALPAANVDTLSRIRRIEMEYHPGGDVGTVLRRLQECGFTLESVGDNFGAPGYGTAKLYRSDASREAARDASSGTRASV